MQGADQGQLLSLAYKVRNTPSADRTKDEKRWVSMDVLVNSGLYTHVTELEAEAMKFDEEYEVSLPSVLCVAGLGLLMLLFYLQITLDREEVQRILKLPSEIQLALPFLHNPDQLYAHKILNHYSKEKGEEHYKQKDLAFQDDASQSVVVAGTGGMDEAEKRSLLELLMKERRSSRARAKLVFDRTKEERDFVTMDKIMRPAFYEELDRIAAAKEEEDRKKRGRKLVVECLEDVDKTDDLGSKYEGARKAYVQNLETPPDWTCTLSAQELDGVLQMSSRELEKYSEQHRYCKELMEKYYVPDEDTRVGRRLINLLLALEGVMPTAIKVDPEEQESSTAMVAKPQEQQERVFGSWKVTHPAGGGMESQQSAFKRDSVAHPASFSGVARLGSSKRKSKVLEQVPNMSEQGFVIVRTLENLANLAGGSQAEEIKVSDKTACVQ